MEIIAEIGQNFNGDLDSAFRMIIAAKENNNNELVHEIADLWFHCLVLLSEKNLKVEDIIKELKSREGISGIEEKNNRNNK